jgi:hypothetical protein
MGFEKVDEVVEKGPPYKKLLAAHPPVRHCPCPHAPCGIANCIINRERKRRADLSLGLKIIFIEELAKDCVIFCIADITYLLFF